jgi:hypothetical protein
VVIEKDLWAVFYLEGDTVFTVDVGTHKFTADEIGSFTKPLRRQVEVVPFGAGPEGGSGSENPGTILHGGEPLSAGAGLDEGGGGKKILDLGFWIGDLGIAREREGEGKLGAGGVGGGWSLRFRNSECRIRKPEIRI